MIAYIKGTIEDVTETNVVIENGGIGYDLLVPASVIRTLPAVGEEIKIYTYLYVREDILQLYGFLTRDELEMFKMLITVSGIGPKGAIGILSVMDVDTLRFAILSEDAASLAKAPGIGKKTAGKLILELKDKCNLEETIESSLQGKKESMPENHVTSDAVQALVALGYSNTEALQAVKKVTVTDDMDVEDVLRASLKNL